MLQVRNLSGVNVTLTGLAESIVVPASASSSKPGVPVDVTSELHALSSVAFGNLETQRVAAGLAYEWTSYPEYNTHTLGVSALKFRDCKYLVVSPSTWNPLVMVAADVGATSLSLGDRIFCDSGAHIGVWLWDGAACVVDPEFFVVNNTCITVGESTYRQTAATGSGTAVFEPVGSGNVAVNHRDIYTSKSYTDGIIVALLTPGAYATFQAQSTQFWTNISVTALVGAGTSANQYPRVRYQIDGGAFVESQLTSATTRIGTSGLAAGWHTFRFEFVSTQEHTDRYTATPPLGAVIVTSYTVDGPALLAPATKLTQRIRFDGDSITEGVNILGSDDLPASCRSYLAWPRLLADSLGYEYDQCGYGGCGWSVAGSGNIPIYGTLADNYSAGASRLVAGKLPDPPDIWMISIGRVDGSTDIVAAVQSRISAARSEVGAACEIFVCVPLAGTQRANITTAVANYLLAHPTDYNTHLLDCGTLSLTYTDGIHPDQASHVTAAAAIEKQMFAARVATGVLQMYTARHLSSLTVVSGAVSAIASRVGTITELQASAPNRPAYVPGGQPCLSFAAASSQVMIESASVPAMGVTNTVIVVVRLRSYTGTYQSPFVGKDVVFYIPPASGHWLTNAGGLLDCGATLVLNEWTMMTLKCTAANDIWAYTQGGNATHITTGTAWANRGDQRIGADSSYYFDGDVGDIVVIDHVLTAAELTRAHQQLASYYNIQLQA